MSRTVTAEEVNEICDLTAAIESQAEVFKNFAQGKAFLGPRAVLSQGENAQFAYLARASQDGPTIVKFGTVFPVNAGSEYPVVQTSIIAMSPLNGSVEYIFDGESVTKLRTVAASMVAARALAKTRVNTIAIIGLGHQGIAHAKAFRELYPTAKLIGVGRQKISNEFFDDVVTDSGKIQGAEIVLLATSSSKPVMQSINPGTTVISIGSFAPNRSEVSAEAVRGADLVVVDDVTTSMSQCGSIIDANHDGKLVIKSLGEILLEGGSRHQETQRTLYFSVGLGIQDAALVELILERL
jgi:alanine dehydrogenase